MKSDAEANAESDKTKRDEIDTRNTAEQTIYQTETQLKDLDDKLSDDDKKNLNDKKDDLQNLVKDGSVDNIKTKLEELNKVWSEIYQAMSVQQQESPDQNNEATSSNHKDDNVEDADFEVVDDKKSSKK